MYLFDQRPNTQIDPASQDAVLALRNCEYAVLVGRNNCGKSFILKKLAQEWGASASYIGPARYHNFNVLGSYGPNRNKLGERFSQFMQQIGQNQLNIDNSPMNLQQSIAELTDVQRGKLIEIIDELLDVKFEILHTVSGNSMSQQYISCNGHNLSYTSSGFRLIVTLLTALLDTDYDTFLIDEPELGVSPEAQGTLAEFLFDRAHRTKYFSHIKTIIFATHSTIFLDRKNVGNNFVVEKSGDLIAVTSVKTLAELNKIHFFLLGNRFETLYLPSAVVIVEGKTDQKFIERALNIKFPVAQISVVQGNSDSRIKEILNITRGIFGDLQKSPYRDRIFVVLDSTHVAGLPNQLAQMGIERENIVVWPKNGIEYYYPPSILNSIYGDGDEVSISGDVISRNSLSYNKNELADKVCITLSGDTVHHPEFETLLLERIAQKVA